MHFDYCTTASIDFTLLDETIFSNIIRVGPLFSSYQKLKAIIDHIKIEEREREQYRLFSTLPETG